MRFKKKQKTQIIIGAVLLLAFVGIFFLARGSHLFDVVSGGGATIFSIDSVQTYGNGKDANNTQWIITASLNNGAEKVTGTVDQDTLAKYNLKSIPAKPFRVDFDLRDFSCNYALELDTQKKLGTIYDAQIEEQCLAFKCPFNLIDNNDVQAACINSGGKECEKIIPLTTIPGAGTHTSWCGWMPEESNAADAGMANKYECQNLPQNSQQVVCYCHVKDYPGTNCDVCKGAACNSFVQDRGFPEGWINYGKALGDGGFCCFHNGAGTCTGTRDNGDWRAIQMGIKPEFDVFKVSDQATVSYKGNVKVTFDDGTTYQTDITEKDTIGNLGEFGSVKWVGNFLSNEFCPVPSTDTVVVRNQDTLQYKAVASDAGSNYHEYVSQFTTLTTTDNNYYTYTYFTPTCAVATDPGIGLGEIFSKETSMNALLDRMKTETKSNNEYTCSISTDHNYYICTTKNPVVYPTVKLTVNAASVGIFTPEGMPNIVSYGLSKTKMDNPTLELNPNDVTTIYVQVENIGEEDDSFDVKLDCPFPITQQSSRIVVSSKQMAIAPLSVNGQGLIQNCKIVANSVNWAANRNEFDLKVIVKPICNVFGPIAQMFMTEYGCYAKMPIPSTPCTNTQFWLDSLGKCVNRADIDTGEQKVEILKQVAVRDCSLQCNGNPGCALACLTLGNVKPVCVNTNGGYMSLNDYLCDYENQPNLVIPDEINNTIWIDAPTCQYVCKYGYSMKNGICTEIDTNTKFDQSARFPAGKQIITDKQCETCFDGKKNQNEEGIDCGGICQELYGRDFECGKTLQLHCYNQLQDGDETGVDCGGSCDFKCEDKAKFCTFGYKYNESTQQCNVVPTSIYINWLLLFVLFVVLIVIGYFAYRKFSKKGKRR